MIEAHNEGLWEFYSFGGTKNPADVFTKLICFYDFFAVHNIYT